MQGNENGALQQSTVCCKDSHDVVLIILPLTLAHYAGELQNRFEMIMSLGLVFRNKVIHRLD